MFLRDTTVPRLEHCIHSSSILRSTKVDISSFFHCQQPNNYHGYLHDILDLVIKL